MITETPFQAIRPIIEVNEGLNNISGTYNVMNTEGLYNISNMRKSVSSDIQTLRSGLKKRGTAEFFKTNFEVFGYLMKHSFECSIKLLKALMILKEIQSKSSPNFMIIRITHPNLLHGSDFLCFLFMNY